MDINDAGLAVLAVGALITFFSGAIASLFSKKEEQKTKAGLVTKMVGLVIAILGTLMTMRVI